MAFVNWIGEQERYQTETFKVDFKSMKKDPAKLTDYVTYNLFAAVHEIVEAGQETPWKPWANVDKAEFWESHREKFIGEIVDVMFFIANSLVAVGCTDQELNEAYYRKMAINRQRQAAGYDGKNKCGECGRAFDDKHVEASPNTTELICVDCAIGRTS